MYPRDAKSLSGFDKVYLIPVEYATPASQVVERVPQVSPHLFDVQYYLQALNQIEARLFILRRESAASVISRAWVNRQARHTVQSSLKESHHRARIAEYQKQLVEATSLQQWRKIAEIVERIGNLESENQSQQSTLTSSLQSLDQQRQAKRDKLSYYADHAKKLTEPLMTSQAAEIMALLQQRVTLCNEMAARAQALLTAAQPAPRVVVPTPPRPPVKSTPEKNAPPVRVAAVSQPPPRRLRPHTVYSGSYFCFPRFGPASACGDHPHGYHCTDCCPGQREQLAMRDWCYGRCIADPLHPEWQRRRFPPWDD